MYGGFNPDLERKHQADTDWVFGAASSPCLALIPESDREKYLPVGETQQNSYGDTRDCASRGPINIYEAKFTWLYRNNKLRPENKKWLEDTGYVQGDRVLFSDAFPAILSGTTRQGNSLKAPIEAIRVNGLIPKKLCAFEPWMTWDDYHNPKRITEAMREIGQEFLRRFTLNYERVNLADFPTVLTQDFINAAVFAWPNPVNGEYPRTDQTLNHVIVSYKHPLYTIFDNYPDLVDGDYIKKLAADYNFYEYGYRLYISAERDSADRQIQTTVFETLLKYGLLSYFADWWDRFTRSVRGFLDPGSLGAARSPHWRRVRADHLRKNPACAVCGTTRDVEVHHKLPFHLHPELELDPANLITLCNRLSHHITFGHLGNFKSFNVDVGKDAAAMLTKIKHRP